MFYVGQKVVCVDASPCRHGSKRRLQLGAIYVIEGFDTEDPRSTNLLLRGDKVLFQRGWKGAIGWRPERFRPVVERKTDISALVKIAEEAARYGKVMA